MSLIKWAKKCVAGWARADEGQGLVEYGLILTLIAIVCIGALTILQVGISSLLGTVTGSL